MVSVKEQYESYPYPERRPEDEKKRLITGSPSHPLEIDHYLFGGQRDWSQPLRVLVAGGGTGDALILPAVVAYRGRTHFGSFGARFDGAPERIISDGTPAIGWQPMLRFSRTRAETGVA